MVCIEDNAMHIVLIYGDDGEAVARKALTLMYSPDYGRYMRFIIHVVSPQGRVYYLAPLRELIQNNIAKTLSIKLSGTEPNDLEELIRKLGPNALYIIGRDSAEYRSVLEKHGIKPVIVEEVIGV